MTATSTATATATVTATLTTATPPTTTLIDVDVDPTQTKICDRGILPEKLRDLFGKLTISVENFKSQTADLGPVLF